MLYEVMVGLKAFSPPPKHTFKPFPFPLGHSKNLKLDFGYMQLLFFRKKKMSYFS